MYVSKLRPRALPYLVLVALLTISLPATVAGAGTRKALAVGIDLYRDISPLYNAINDARAVAGALEPLGFAVQQLHNPTLKEFAAALMALERTIGSEDIVFIFYAGHGVEVGGRNFLLPADVPVAETAEQVGKTSIAADVIVERFRNRAPKALFLILDACRDNPFPGQKVGQRAGLGKTDAPGGVFVLMSAGVGQTALDSLGDEDRVPNSIFTRKFVSLLARPDQTQAILAKRVQYEVYNLAATVKHQQSPVYYDEIGIDIVLNRGSPQNPQKSAPK